MNVSGIFNSLSLALESLWEWELRRWEAFHSALCPEDNHKDKDSNHAFDYLNYLRGRGCTMVVGDDRDGMCPAVLKI